MLNKIDTVMVETSGACNLRCVMCPTNSYVHNKDIMDDTIFNKVLDLINNLNIRVVQMYGWGEPLLDPKLANRIKQVRLLKPASYITISSNGSLFNSERVDQILENGINHINISFDAGSKDVYEKIRVNSSFEKTVENLKYLSSKRSKDKTLLCAVFVVLKENLQDMEKAVQLFSGLGFDQLVFSPHLVPYSKDVLANPSFEKTAHSEYLRLKREWEGKFTINGTCFSIEHGVNDCWNHVTSGSIFVNCKGDVSPCCILGHHVPIYKKGFLGGKTEDCFFSIGNLSSQNFREILTSEKYRNFIATFLNSHLPDQCRGCRIVNTKLLHKVEN